jgi:hypothetical protein
VEPFVGILFRSCKITAVDYVCMFVKLLVRMAPYATERRACSVKKFVNVEVLDKWSNSRISF